MSLTLATVPEYPVPKKLQHVTFAASTGNWVRVWMTDAPLGSAWRKKIDESTTARLQVFEGEPGKRWVDSTPFDKGGAYVLTAQEYTRGTGTQGTYAGAPAGYKTETKVGGETPLTIYVGQRMESPIGFGNDIAKLVFWVWDDTIRETTLAVHGEVSPAITNAATIKARAAAESALVRAALDDMIDTTAESAIGDLAAVIYDFGANWSAHRAQAGVHTSDDDGNDPNPAYGAPVAPEAIVLSANYFNLLLYRHMTNDAGGAGFNTGEYHGTDGDSPDLTNLSAVRSASLGNLSSALAAIGCMWLAYEAHRVDTNSHLIADSTNALDPLPLLPKLHGLFCQALGSAAPTPPANVNTAAALLASGGGFTDTTP